MANFTDQENVRIGSIGSNGRRGFSQPGSHSSRQFKHVVALAFLGTIIAGVPLLPFGAGGELFAMPLLAALVVFPSVLIIALAVWALKRSQIPEIVIILTVAVICGALAAIIMFSAIDAIWFGVMITVPVAIITSLLGYLLDSLLRKSDIFVYTAISCGIGLLLFSGVSVAS